MRDFFITDIAQPCQRHMRGKLALIGRQHKALADAFDFGVQRLNVRRRRDTCNQTMGLL